MKTFSHSPAHQILRSHLFRLMHADLDNQHGKRSFLFSAAHTLFKHMQISTIPYAQQVTMPIERPLINPSEVHFFTKDFSTKSGFVFPNICNKVNGTLYMQGIKDIAYNHDKNEYYVDLRTDKQKSLNNDLPLIFVIDVNTTLGHYTNHTNQNKSKFRQKNDYCD